MNANGIDAGNGIDAVCTGAAMGDDRIRELDGLRGVAAAAVFLFHATNLAPPHSPIGHLLTLPFIAAFYASTAPVLLFFVLSIANHHRAMVDAAERLSTITACAIALTAGVLWTGLYVSRPGTMPWLAIQGVGIASAVIVVGAMSRPGVRTVLLKQPIQALGRVTYGFYLLHFPALLLIVCWLMPVIGYWPSVLVAAASTWLASIVVFRVVERPCMAIARRLGAAFHRSHAHNG